MFLDSVLHAASCEFPSLRSSSIETKKIHKIKIKEQSLNARFNDEAIDFMKAVLAQQISNQINSILSNNFFDKFNRVCITDCTKYQIDELFKEHYPGSGGSASEAGIGHQFELNIKTGGIVDLTFVPSNQSDSKYAKDNIDKVEARDLFIRDLGYFSLEVLKKINEKLAFYLSRLNNSTKVFEEKNDKIVEISFEKIYLFMLENKVNILEKQVFAGVKDKLKTRLIIELLPDAIYQKRLAIALKNCKHQGTQLSQEHKTRMHFNLIITNVLAEDLSIENVYLLYKIRWQIELNFKIWKSTFKIDKIKKMKYERFMCIMLAKLILITINYELTSNLRNHFYNSSNKLLSYTKCFITLKDNVRKIRNLFFLKSTDLLLEVTSIVELLEDNNWLEKKNKQVGLDVILNKLSKDCELKHYK